MIYGSKKSGPSIWQAVFTPVCVFRVSPEGLWDEAINVKINIQNHELNIGKHDR